MAEGLAAVAEHARIGILSNVDDALVRATQAYRLVDPEWVLSSERLGSYKPDPAIYRTAAQRLGVAPGDCVYVGDGADGELAGAAAVGMTVLRTTEHQDTEPGWIGTVIANLGQVLAHVEQPASIE